MEVFPMGRMFPVIMIWMLMLTLSGCLDNVTEVPLSISDAGIPAPTGLTARIDDGSVALHWHAVANVSGYRIYRSVDTSAHSVPLADVADTAYVDADVQNGRIYFYSVSALREGGIEGKRSVEIYAVPSVYSIMINGGETSTNSRSVALTLTAPETTEQMMIADNASLVGGTWETYAATRAWRLEGPDGIKRVYAAFRDQSGAISPEACDSIVLDTYAMIESISISPVPRQYAVGTVAHFAMHVEDDERGGAASVSFENFSGRVDLYDDGRGGDPTADDGVYEVDFRFPESIRGIDVAVRGDFLDEVGNAAPQFECPDRISFTDPPEPVLLIGAADSSTTSITILWTASEEEHFRSYRIYRNTSPTVSETPSQLVRELSNIAQTTYPDGSLKEGVQYYYRIFVVNDLNETAGSNTISTHTFDAYPEAVVLAPPSSKGLSRLTLTWSENGASDFKEYRVYRSTAPGVTTSSMLVATISEREQTYCDDTGLDLAGNTYYYRIYVFDLGGKSSRSNEVDTAE
jgi:fibronectin type 3 domain-containing protein